MYSFVDDVHYYFHELRIFIGCAWHAAVVQLMNIARKRKDTRNDTCLRAKQEYGVAPVLRPALKRDMRYQTSNVSRLSR